MRLSFLRALAAVLLASSAAWATPWVPRSQLVLREGSPASLTPRPLAPYTAKDADARLALVATWLETMQIAGPCGDAGACNAGGIREVESGAGYSIVESDNTHESVFIWSYQRGRDPQKDHAQAITNAFDYLGLNPGWLEWKDTSDPGPDYYSLYNCGWAMRAVLAYEAATKDMSHHAYGAMCAQHAHDNAMTVAQPSNLIDKATAGWAASGLWLWSHAQGDAAGEQTAADVGAVLKAWIDAQPSRLSSSIWAVTGGAVFDAVVGTYMKAHPDELAGWAAQVAPQLGGWIDESQPQSPNDWTDWRNAHVAWNMLAQFDAARALSGGDADMHWQIASDLLDKLWTQDADMDGAIPGSQQRPATEDESWITAYFTVFGLRQLYDPLPPQQPDAGAPGDAGDDAGAPADGGTGGKGSGGCSCEAAPGPRWDGALAAVVGAAVLARRVTRRARRR